MAIPGNPCDIRIGLFPADQDGEIIIIVTGDCISDHGGGIKTFEGFLDDRYGEAEVILDQFRVEGVDFSTAFCSFIRVGQSSTSG